METDPFVSTGKFINHSDPMISTGIEKKDVNYLFNKFEKKMAVFLSI